MNSYTCFFDVESTGLSSKDEVIQFGAVIVDSVTFKVQRVINRYFLCSMPVPAEATQVHGITDEMLVQKSNGQFFEDLVMTDPLFYKEPNVLFVSYGNFDTRCCNQTLENSGYKSIYFGNRTATLKTHFTGRYYADMMQICSSLYARGKYNLTLHKSLQEANLEQGLIENAFKMLLKENNIVFDQRAIFHDALYDAFCLFLITWKLGSKIRHG